MSLESAVKEMTELRTSANCLFEVYEVGALAAAIGRLIMMRNDTVGKSDHIVAARRQLLDPAIMLLKAQLKKDIPERLVPALQAWEKVSESA